MVVFPRRGAKGHEEHLLHLFVHEGPLRATKDREERQRQHLFVHEGPRRKPFTPFCPRRATKDREERQRQHLFVHEGPRRKPFTPFLIREGAEGGGRGAFWFVVFFCGLDGWIAVGGGRWASCLGCTCEVLSFDIRGGYLYRLGGGPARCGRAEATRFGAIAQLGERYNGIVEVKGSSPFSSTRRDGRIVCVPVFVSWMTRFDL